MTPFQKKVYQVVKRISRGSVLTYKGIASAIGRPKAVRAVGNTLNKNRDSWVPCHRVIRSDRKIGGYNRGAVAKIKLLRQEGVSVDTRVFIVSSPPLL
ncbi:MAG: hypothetical protein A3C07_04025 [Candidatus Sungbacteria bacterium RIFCSPHIGHO2_02_FULL_47_11]|uniref:Methylated-DNA-[protein]-cysteine S-methyltransferase DNA binding domain-containing protein n=1 Tax=Candidatus Sungbacteria bacterium RIFCSPHIGHO2_02_FULL_47_11 TaxID=1802270 RepID=A0A1G2KGM7_9BACT|nr:MAG: hypothetical protein A3C07_04025 [Candidatus Sungbacteria bacterium RIFCSPHIGHO2_02_FULL_47_11]